jgi:hypothetical protein
MWLGIAALAGWVALAGASGGIALGQLPWGRGETGMTWALVVGPVLVAAAMWRARGARWTAPALLGAGAMAGLVAWCALSIAWASAPDLAWLAANRLALTLAALVFGLAAACRLREPADRLATGMAAACVPIVGWALGSRALPELLAPIVDTPRLAAPIGHANGLAMVVVIAVPGALLLGARPPWRGIAAALLACDLIVIALTGSRSGLLALAATVAVAVWLLPDRPATLGTLGAAIVGAIPATVYGLTAGPLTREPFLADPSERRSAGLVFGLLVIAGAATAAALHEPIRPAAGRLATRVSHPAAGRALLIGAGVVIVAGAIVATLHGRGAGSGAGRVISVDSNNRVAWWGQAARGFADAPLAGHGGGSFPLTNIAERTVAADTLRVREPHQLVLELLTELGAVGLLLAGLAVAGVVWAARRAGRAAVAPAVCMTVGFLVQAQLDVPWTTPAVMVPVAAAAGVMLAAGGTAAGGRWGAARAVAVAAIGAAAIASSLVLSVASTRASDAVLADANPREVVRLAPDAASLNPLAIGALLAEARARAQLGDDRGAVRVARLATGRQPENPFAWECLAAVGAAADRAEATVRLVRLDPRRDPTVLPRCQPGW